MINAGQMDQRVTLQQRASGQNALGEVVGSWVDVDTVWAKVEPLRGREYFASGAMQTAVEVRITIRRRADVSTTWRVLWRGQAHEVVSVIDPRAQGETLELMCTAGIRDGRS